MGREVIEEIIRAAAEVLRPSDLAASLEAMQRIVGASQSLVFTFTRQRTLSAIAGPIGPILREKYAPYYAETDPLQHGLKSPPVAPYTLLHQRGSFDVVSREVYLASIAYREVHAPHDLEHQLLVLPSGMRYGEPGMVGMLFTRARHETPFEPRDLRPMRALEPALRAAARRSRRFAEVQNERDALTDLLAVDEPRAVFAEGAPGARWVNEAGARVFARLPDLRIRMEEQARALGRALERPLDELVPTTFDLRVGPRERAIGDLHVVRDRAGRPLVLCHFTVLDDDAKGPTCKPKLTPTEGVVLARVMRGLANKEIAADLGVSPETVRSHLKSIFRKLGVDTRVKAALWAREHLPSSTEP